MPRTPKLHFDLSRHAPDLTTAIAIRLHPRVGAAAPTASKMGGPIAWPLAEPWPCCPLHGAPLVPVLQLNRCDVPRLAFPEGAERFQLLWCPRDHEDRDYGPRAEAWWRDGTTEPWADTPSPGERARNDYLPRQCVVHPEEVVELPSAFELDPRRVDDLDEIIRSEAAEELSRLGIPEETALYQYHFSVAPGTKAGGFVPWIQDPEVPVCQCGAPMQHLVTIGSAEFDGAYQRWMPLDERHVWGEGYAARDAVQCAAGLMLGDMGALFVFVCTACPARPIATRFQCS